MKQCSGCGSYNCDGRCFQECELDYLEVEVTHQPKLVELAERCATGPSRELDDAIFVMLNPALFPHKTKAHFFVNSERLRDTEYQSRNTFTVPRYTTSLDAAMTLVPEGWTYEAYQGPSGRPHKWKLRTISDGDKFYTEREGKAATPALALCAAALRAME